MQPVTIYIYNLESIIIINIFIIYQDNPCFNNPCLNGATCQTTGTGSSSYICICAQYYSGATCQICKKTYQKDF